MRRLLLVLTVGLAMAAMVVASAMPVFAATPPNNCAGQVNKSNNSVGSTPAEIAQTSNRSNAGEWEKFVRSSLVC